MIEAKRYAAIVVDVPSRAVDRPFHYRIPGELVDSLRVGHRVYVPFGQRRVTGYVIDLLTRPEVDHIRDIIALVDEEPLLSRELVQLVHWMAQRYQCLLIDGIRAVVPSGIHITAVKVLRPSALPKGGASLSGLSNGARELVSYLEDNPQGVPLSELRACQKHVMEVVEAGLAEQAFLWMDPKVKPKYVNRCFLVNNEAAADELAASLERTAPKQAKVLRVLSRADGRYSPAELARAAGTTSAAVAALRNKGIIRVVRTEVQRDPYAGREFSAPARVVPNQWQQQALGRLFQSLDSSEGGVFLLHGVTGSGKTEVYLRLIERVLQQNKTAITLVPEIALTPQTVRRFKERFGTDVAVLHSRLSMGERYDEWRRIRNGAVRVVVGARSAVFAPVQNLGVIIIDEEHESSYKQEENPKYHARDVAIFRAELCGATVVLGSATPSVESYYRASVGDYVRLEMNHRVDGRSLPPVEIVDMREELKQGNRTIFSASLRSSLRQCLEQGHQAILLLNRRGFASFVLCRECGATLRCPHCRVSLTFHRLENSVTCHYCGYFQAVPSTCPECGSKYLRQFGAGTERVAAELAEEFPQARILRMDVDTTGTKGAHERILGQFERRKADFLVGTQMIAKGLDFPGVALVGVVTADTALNLPDFRAGERTFQLLTQVAGRAGRGDVPGRVIVQTYTPGHYSIIAAQNHDYELFVRREMQFRKRLRYPPFVTLGRVLVSGRDEKQVMTAARDLADWCRSCLDSGGQQDGEVIGPSPAPLSKLRDRYRWHVLVKLSSRKAMEDLFADINKRAYAKKEQIRVSVDIDPMSVL